MENRRLEYYKRIRQVARGYLSGLITEEKYPDVDPVAVGKLLGIYRSGKMIFENENEVSALMDFSIAEKIYDGKSIIEREIETNQEMDDDKRTILEAFSLGYTSLFEILGNKAKEYTVQLHDLLNDEDKEIIDINLSRSVSSHKSGLLFFRIVFVRDFAMTSGVTFAFRSEYKDVLLRRYRSEIRNRFLIDKSITRFLIFHRLNRKFGEVVKLV